MRLTPVQLTTQLGTSPDVIRAMVKAERAGLATVGNAVIRLAGYQTGDRFDASTGLYSVTI